MPAIRPTMPPGILFPLSAAPVGLGVGLELGVGPDCPPVALTVAFKVTLVSELELVSVGVAVTPIVSGEMVAPAWSQPDTKLFSCDCAACTCCCSTPPRLTPQLMHCSSSHPIVLLHRHVVLDESLVQPEIVFTTAHWELQFDGMEMGKLSSLCRSCKTGAGAGCGEAWARSAE